MLRRVSRLCGLRSARTAGLRAETIPGFRPWLIDRMPWLKRAAGLIPDDGGLNVEALSWDPRRKALLFGLRTPALDGKPVVLRVKPRRIDCPWTLDNLQVLPALTLAVPDRDDDAGIRAMSLDQSTGTSLIILGNSTSQSNARFKLYSWDGNPRGIVRRYPDVRFHKRMKVEGVTRGRVQGRPAVDLRGRRRRLPGAVGRRPAVSHDRAAVAIAGRRLVSLALQRHSDCLSDVGDHLVSSRSSSLRGAEGEVEETWRNANAPRNPNR